MSLIRDFIDPGGRMLARRLDQLCSTLESLGARLRGTIASAVGETIGSLVRDTALCILDELTQCVSGSAPISPLSRNVPGTLEREYFESGERDYWTDEEDEFDPIVDDELALPTAPRLPAALSAGLQAASWWLRRWSGRCGAVTTLAVGLLATGIAFLGGPVAATLLGLAEAATQFTSLSQVIGLGASAFGLDDSA